MADVLLQILLHESPPIMSLNGTVTSVWGVPKVKTLVDRQKWVRTFNNTLEQAGGQKDCILDFSLFSYDSKIFYVEGIRRFFHGLDGSAKYCLNLFGNLIHLQWVPTICSLLICEEGESF